MIGRMAKVPLLNKPGVTNWVEKFNALPKGSWIRRAAEHLKGKGMADGHAIATAVNAAEKLCATGDLNWPGIQSANAGSRAEACAAVAVWKAAAARAKADLCAPAVAAFALIDLSKVQLGDRPDVREPNSADVLELTADRLLEQRVIDLAGPAEGSSGSRGWNESAHPRGQKGSSRGGKFVAKGQQAPVAQRGRKQSTARSGPVSPKRTQGQQVAREQHRVLRALDKLPASDRPDAKLIGAVRTALSDSGLHGGRLGPRKRLLLGVLARQLPAGSVARAEVVATLRADVPKSRAKANV